MNGLEYSLFVDLFAEYLEPREMASVRCACQANLQINLARYVRRRGIDEMLRRCRGALDNIGAAWQAAMGACLNTVTVLNILREYRDCHHSFLQTFSCMVNSL